LPSATLRPAGEPLPEIWRRFFDLRAGTLAPASRKNYRRCELLSRGLPAYPSPADVVVWLSALGRAGNAPGTVELYRSILRALYALAQLSGWATANPAALAPWRRPPLPEPHPIREIRKLWPRLLEVVGPSPRARAFLGMLRFTGVRIEEALGLTPGDVLTGSPWWFVSVVRQRVRPNSMRTAPVKGRRERGKRRIPARPELVELLRPALALPPARLRFGTREAPRRSAEVPFLFPYREHDLGELRERLALAFPEHFGPGRAWHTFRHTLAWEMYAAGKPVELVARVLGHESVQTTEKYLGRLAGAPVPAEAFQGL
jgi:integrase